MKVSIQGVRCFLCSILFFLQATLAMAEQKSTQKIMISGGYTGPVKEYFEEILRDFNHSQKEYEARFIGQQDYNEAFKATRDVFEQKDASQLADIYLLPEFGVGEIMMLLENQEGFIPISMLLPELSRRGYLAGTDLLYSKNGSLYAYPNIAVGVVRYNKTLFEEAQKIDPQLRSVALDTVDSWEALMDVAARVSDALNQKSAEPIYGFTFPWTFAYTLEHTFSIAGVPLTTYQNGFEHPLKARFELAQHSPSIHYFERLYRLSKRGVFKFVGEFSNEADDLFARGRSFILLNGANREPVIESLMKKHGQSFSIEYGVLPYNTEMQKDAPLFAPKTGGTGLWVRSGHEGVKAFLTYVTRPDVQAAWCLKTGYLPADDKTLQAYEKLIHTPSISAERGKLIKVALSQIEARKAGQFTHMRVPVYGEVRGEVFNRLFDAFLKAGPLSSQSSPSKDDIGSHKAVTQHVIEFLRNFDREANQKMENFALSQVPKTSKQ